MIRPDFIIIGAMKCGTTTAYHMLSRHPEIGMSRDKETDFFIAERNYHRGPEWYSGQFDPAFRIHGEASPNYTKSGVFGGVPDRMAKYCPDTRLIYMVRDPVERLVSQYRHSWVMGEVSMAPEEFMADAWEFEHALDTSRYHRQLQAFLERWSMSQIMVVDFDELLASPDVGFNAMLSFIGASKIDLGGIGRFNENSQVSRIPRPFLRLAQSSAGKALTRLIGGNARRNLRNLLTFGSPRQPPAIPQSLRDQAAIALKDDAMAFRDLTGMPFTKWAV